MARENILRLRAVVDKKPKITINDNGSYAIVVLAVVSPNRETGDNLRYAQVSKPRLMTQNPDMIKEIESWEENDIVDIKGVLATRTIPKTSYCPICHTKNSNPGSFTYIVPNYVEKIKNMPSIEKAMEYLLDKREISNSVNLFGTLLTNPKMLTTYAGLDFTQYKLAANRKYRIKEDDPSRKVDYPWVKSYGDRARLDRFRLQKGAEIYIDGCLQEREIRRGTICGQLRDEYGQYVVSPSTGEPIIKKDADGNPLGCGQKYYWKDRTLEIVPFSVEYVSGVLSEQEAEERQRKRILQHEKDNGSVLFNRTLYDVVSEKDRENGFDDEDSAYKDIDELSDDEYKADVEE